MPKPEQPATAFKARLAPGGLEGQEAVPELASRFGVQLLPAERRPA